MKQIKSHPCQWLDLFVKDPRVAINYWPNVRMYIICNLKESTLIKKVKKGIKITYCPWCKTKLPSDLYNEWFATLKKEVNLDNPWDKEQEKLIPEEFKTDEWWKKREY